MSSGITQEVEVFHDLYSYYQLHVFMTDIPTVSQSFLVIVLEDPG